MKWPWLPPTRKDVIVIAVTIAIGAAVFFFLLRYPVDPQGSNFGFGPEWTCHAQPKGDPVCIKKKPD